MLDSPTASAFSHVKPGHTPWRGGGLRDFSLCRDLGIAGATGGRVIAQLVRANEAPEAGTGWRRHAAEFHITLMLKGGARFLHEDQETLVSAGDCVHQHPFDCSPDRQYLEVFGPAGFSTVGVAGPCLVPHLAPWPSPV